MILAEKIQEYIQKLPASLQSEVLDYIEYLLDKAEQETGRREEKAWSDFSFSSAMRGIENDDAPIYGPADLKVIFT